MPRCSDGWKRSPSDFGKPFRHTARYNHRLRTTGGRYFPDHRTINPAYLEAGRRRQGIIRYELCHYHLHLKEGLSPPSPEFRRLRAGG